MKKYNNETMKSGFTILISTLIISAVILTISIGSSLRSVGEVNVVIGESASHRALSLANLCAEEALFKLESVFEYQGNETINVGGESCDVLVQTSSGNFNRTIEAQSTVGKHTRRVRVEVAQISNIMKITSWEEIADF